jgi:hypothetical protein
VVVVENLDERLYLGSLLDLLLAHSLNDLAGISIDASHWTPTKLQTKGELSNNRGSEAVSKDAIPTAWPNFLPSFPSSAARTITALRPANRPAVTITTFPLLKLR